MTKVRHLTIIISVMKKALSLVSKIHDKGCKFIVDQLVKNGIEGLVPSHGDILAVLYECERSTMKDLALKIHRTKPTVTVLVDKLEKEGFLKRQKSDSDSRVTYIVLTQKGKAFRPVFEKISEELNRMLYANLTPKEAAELDRLLEKMV